MAIYRQTGRTIWTIRLWVAGKGLKSFSSKTTDKLKAQQIELQLRLGQARRIEHDRVVAFVESITMEGLDKIDRGLPLSLAWDEYRALPEFRLSLEQTRKKHDAWRRFLRWLEEHHAHVKHMPEVTRDHAYEFMRSLMDGSLKGKSVNLLRGNVSSIFQALLYKAKLKENPFSVVRLAPTDDSDRGRALTVEECGRLLKVAKDPWYGASLVAMYTGLRFTDVAHLRWDEITDDSIAKTPSKTRRRGVKVWIPLHPKLAEYLRSRDREGEWVFPYLETWYDEVQRDGTFGKLLEKAKIHAGAGEYVGFHSLRHTFVTRLAAAGVPQDIRMKLAGHTLSVTHGRYDHDMKQAADAISRLE